MVSQNDWFKQNSPSCRDRIFTALHWIQGGHENGVRLPVRPSNAWQNGKKRNGLWRRPLLAEILGEIADFEPIFARTASAVTPSGKSSINTNRKSTTRFPMSLRWSSYVAPKSRSRTQNGRFRCKISHFAWRKSATKFLCVKTVSDKVARHSWPNYPCKNDWWGRPKGAQKRSVPNLNNKLR